MAPHHHAATTVAVLNTMMIRHSKDLHIKPIEDNQAYVRSSADRLAIGGELEGLFHDHDMIDDPWLEDQRQRLIRVAETHDTMKGHVDTFLHALEHVLAASSEPQQQQQQQDGNGNDNVDYEQAIRDYINKHNGELQETRQTATNPGNNRATTATTTTTSHVADLCSRLGIKRDEITNSTVPAIHDDGDELEIVPGIGDKNHSTMTGRSLKCPLTGKWLDDPVRNILCGHAYSKEAMLRHLTCSTNCPVAGCRNQKVNAQQLTPDLELTQLVRRQKRRSENVHRRERVLLNQDLDSGSENDCDDGGDGTPNHMPEPSFLPMAKKSRVKAKKEEEDPQGG